MDINIRQTRIDVKSPSSSWCVIQLHKMLSLTDSNKILGRIQLIQRQTWIHLCVFSPDEILIICPNKVIIICHNNIFIICSTMLFIICSNKILIICPNKILVYSVYNHINATPSIIDFICCFTITFSDYISQIFA